MQESTPSEEASRDVRANGGDVSPPAEVPAWGEQRWVVMVSEAAGTRVDEDGTERVLWAGLYIVDPKTGGVASTYDPGTWADASRAENYARMANSGASDKLWRCLAYVDGEGCVRWPDGTLVKRWP